MTTAEDIRELLREAEGFLRERDPWGATARAKFAARQAASVRCRDPAELQQEVRLVLDRLEAAEKGVREEVEKRAGLHVANERHATEITDVAPLERPPPSRRARIAALFARMARKRFR